jgi:hypothetical protein
VTVHAPSDVRSISIPTHRGGCGLVHEAGDLPDGARFSVDCPSCEPAIIATRTGWAHTPEGVHLTPDEIGVADAEAAKAQRESNKTWANPAAMFAMFQKAGAQPAAVQAAAEMPSLLAQIAALSPEERAALGAMLAAPTPETDVEPDGDEPDGSVSEGESTADADLAAPKRRGRKPATVSA